MQISSNMGMSAVYAASMQSAAAKVNPEVNAAATEAAAQAQAAMYGLSTAIGGASESIMNIASGQLSNAVDIQA